MNLIEIYIQEVTKGCLKKVVRILLLSYGQRLRICYLMIIMRKM